MELGKEDGLVAASNATVIRSSQKPVNMTKRYRAHHHFQHVIRVRVRLRLVYRA